MNHRSRPRTLAGLALCEITAYLERRKCLRHGHAEPLVETWAELCTRCGDVLRLRPTVNPAGLTDAEHEAMDLTAQLMNLFARRVVAHGRTREQDIDEFCRNLHVLQHAIMSQAAARQHPDRYRLLGGVIA